MGEKSTYFYYRDGFSPDLLELGSLVFDFKNPRTRRPFTNSSWRDMKDSRKDLVDESPRSKITLVYQTDSGWDVGGGIQSLASLSFSQAAGGYTVVTGKKGSKEELIEPETYFSDILLQSSSAKLWLSARLSIVRRLEYLRKKTIRPTIWMLTGRYIVENASVRSYTQSASSTSLKGTIPLDPTGATELVNLNPEGHFSIGSGVLHAAKSKFDGQRVFAAQYQKLDAEYVLVKPGSLFVASSIHLSNTLSSQRGGDFEVARLQISGERVDETTTIPVQEEITEEYWQEFDEAVVDLEEQQEED